MILSFLQWANKFQARSFSQVLLYHSTYSKVPPEIKVGLHNITPDVLRLQLSWLKHNFDIVTLDQIFNTPRPGEVAITFDDAYLSVFTQALPVLSELKIPTTIFVNGASLVGKALWRDKVRYLINNNLVEQFIGSALDLDPKVKVALNANFYKNSKDPTICNSMELDQALDQFFQTKPLDSAPLTYCATLELLEQTSDLIQFGNHTMNHYVLSSLSEKQQRYEIAENQTLLSKLSRPISQIFSLPFGGQADLNPATILILKELGFRGILFSRNRFNQVRSDNSQESITSRERYMVNPTFSGFQKQLLKLGLKARLP